MKNKIIITLLIIIAFIGGFFTNKILTQKEIIKYQQNIIALQEEISKISKNYKNSEITDFINSINYEPNLSKKKISNKIKKPKLVIIIDDVAFKNEAKMIKKIPLKITPSFLPPNYRHPYSFKYAQEFSSYMVHLPLQAIHYAHPEPNTIKTNWNYNKIKEAILKIKNEFPKVKFINNHTGSKFTSDYNAMKKLFKVLKEEHLGFVDSKTTPYSKSTKVNKIYHIPLFSRDIFLDNEINQKYIRRQLKKAVKIAQKQGYAIVIGHPHKTTLMTLKNSTDILKKVDVIYINELEKYAKN